MRAQMIWRHSPDFSSIANNINHMKDCLDGIESPFARQSAARKCCQPQQTQLNALRNYMRLERDYLAGCRNIFHAIL
jgi:hypothetical protein